MSLIRKYKTSSLDFQLGRSKALVHDDRRKCFLSRDTHKALRYEYVEYIHTILIWRPPPFVPVQAAISRTKLAPKRSILSSHSPYMIDMPASRGTVDPVMYATASDTIQTTAWPTS